MAKTKKATQTPSKKKESGDYVFTIKLNDEVKTLAGDSVLEVLKAFEIPAFVKTDFVMEVKKGDVVKTKSLNVFQTRRLFGNSTALEIFASDLTDQLG